MGEENTQAANNDSNNDIIPPSAITEYVDEVPDDSKNITQPTDCSENVNKELPTINLPPQNKRYKRNEIIAIWVGVAIQAVLASFTYLLFLKTGEANRESIRANNISQAALDDSRMNQIRSDSLNSIIRKNDIARDSINTGLDRQSVKDQSNYLRQTQERFEKENEPFLEITVPELPEFDQNAPLIISGDINNLGKYPCKVIRMKVAMSFRNGYAGFEELRFLGLNDTKIKNTYITNNLAATFQSRYPTIISQEQVENIMGITTSFFYWGYVIYENLVSKTEKTYKFMIRFFFQKEKGMIAHEFIVNENTEGLLPSLY